MPSSDHWDAQVSGVHVEHPELRGLGERNYDVGVFPRTSILGMGKAEQEAETLREGLVSCPWLVHGERWISCVKLEGPVDLQMAWQGGSTVQVLAHRDAPDSEKQD